MSGDTDKAHAKTRARVVADLLWSGIKPSLRDQFREFVEEWENEHGPVDLCRYYTSRWPERERTKLFEADPAAYFDGLAAVMQSFIKGKFDQCRDAGKLDDQEPYYLRLYLSGFMNSRGFPPER